MNMKETLEIIALIGVPSLFTVCVYFIRVSHQTMKRLSILMQAQQKQMRRDLMCDYHKFMADGFISDEDMDTWESSYQAYHSLGVNGIMDTRRDDLLRLPNEKPQNKEN